MSHMVNIRSYLLAVFFGLFDSILMIVQMILHVTGLISKQKSFQKLLPDVKNMLIISFDYFVNCDFRLEQHHT